MSYIIERGIKAKDYLAAKFAERFGDQMPPVLDYGSHATVAGLLTIPATRIVYEAWQSGIMNEPYLRFDSWPEVGKSAVKILTVLAAAGADINALNRIKKAVVGEPLPRPFQT